MRLKIDGPDYNIFSPGHFSMRILVRPDEFITGTKIPMIEHFTSGALYFVAVPKPTSTDSCTCVIAMCTQQEVSCNFNMLFVIGRA